MTKPKKSKVKPITHPENFFKQYFFALIHSKKGEPDFRVRQLNRGLCVILDAEDFERFKNRSIKIGGRESYCKVRPNIAEHNGLRNNILFQLSRLLLDPESGLVCDHINHNILDNRRANLRAVTLCQNSWNARLQEKVRRDGMKYKGVYKKTGHKRIIARICKYGKHYLLGLFPNTAEGAYQASQAYDRKALELFGEFACLNHPRQKEKYLKQLSAKRNTPKAGQDEKLCHSQKKK